MREQKPSEDAYKSILGSNVSPNFSLSDSSNTVPPIVNAGDLETIIVVIRHAFYFIPLRSHQSLIFSRYRFMDSAFYCIPDDLRSASSLSSFRNKLKLLLHQQ